jgi:hypothetical protein
MLSVEFVFALAEMELAERWKEAQRNHLASDLRKNRSGTHRGGLVAMLRTLGWAKLPRQMGPSSPTASAKYPAEPRTTAM